MTMAQTPTLPARRTSDLPSCTNRLALNLNEHPLDLNRDALDLNKLPLISPETPFSLLDTHPFSQPPPPSDSTPLHAATNFLIGRQPVETTNPRASQAASSSNNNNNNKWQNEFGGGSCDQGISDGLEFCHKPDEGERQSVGSGEESGDSSCSAGEGSRDAEKAQDRPWKSFIKVTESPNWLPAGWITEIKTRKAGSTAGTRDKYYRDPISGSRFRSRNEVIYYLRTGRKTRCKMKQRLLDAAAAAQAILQSSCEFHDGRTHFPPFDGAKEQQQQQPKYDVPPMASPFDLGTHHRTAQHSEYPLHNSSPEVPAWLRRILPVGAFPDFADCNAATTYPGSTLSQPQRLQKFDLNVEADMGEGSTLNGESGDLMVQKNNGENDRYHQIGHKVHHDTVSPLLRHVAVWERQHYRKYLPSVVQAGPLVQSSNLFHVGDLVRGREEWESDQRCFEEFFRQDLCFRQQDCSNAEQMHMQHVHCNFGILGKDEKKNQKCSFSCDDLTRQYAVSGMLFQNNLASASYSQSLKDIGNACAPVQDPNHNLPLNKSPMLHQGRRSWTKHIGLKKFQKLNSKEEKELLTLLGRKLCWQGLSLLAEGARRHSKELNVG